MYRTLTNTTQRSRRRFTGRENKSCTWTPGHQKGRGFLANREGRILIDFRGRRADSRSGVSFLEVGGLGYSLPGPVCLLPCTDGSEHHCRRSVARGPRMVSGSSRTSQRTAWSIALRGVVTGRFVSRQEGRAGETVEGLREALDCRWGEHAEVEHGNVPDCRNSQVRTTMMLAA